MSTEQAKVSSKHLGEGIAADVIQHFPLETVTDTEAVWHDAETTAAIFPERPERLLFGGICAVEPDTPVEIKATLAARSAGDEGDRPGQWVLKRQSHDRLVDAGGVYLFVVYVQRGQSGRRHVGRIIMPAATVDDIISDSWYDAPQSRSEGKIAQLSWTRLLDDNQLTRGGCL
jgi:hypothetical protein